MALICREHGSFAINTITPRKRKHNVLVDQTLLDMETPKAALMLSTKTTNVMSA